MRALPLPPARLGPDGEMVFDLPDRPGTPASQLFDCMVCGNWRHNDDISVARRTVPAFDQLDLPDDPRINKPAFFVRYCNDRPECVAHATADGHWQGPPDTSG